MTLTRRTQSPRRPSPYPSVDSASEYTPEAQPEPSVSTGVKRRSRTGLTPEERREARAHRNRIAAQCSRDRKKAQFADLSARVAELEAENRALRLGVQSTIPQLSDASIAQENAALKARVQQLELAWQNMAKLIGSMPLQAQPPALFRPQPLMTLPLSPAPTTLSAPESLETPAEPTCESAAGGSLGKAIGTQTPYGAESGDNTDWLAMYTSSTTTDVKTFSPSASNPLLLTDIDSLISTAALDQGSQEMERLLSLLPTQDGPNEGDLDLAVLGTAEDWSWLTNDAVF